MLSPELVKLYSLYNNNLQKENEMKIKEWFSSENLKRALWLLAAAVVIGLIVVLISPLMATIVIATAITLVYIKLAEKIEYLINVAKKVKIAVTAAVNSKMPEVTTRWQKVVKQLTIIRLTMVNVAYNYWVLIQRKFADWKKAREEREAARPVDIKATVVEEENHTQEPSQASA